jgi:hypothetical protein
MGVLRAIEAELTVHKDALESLSDRLKRTPAGSPLATMPVDQNFFIVFEANAAALGKIDNQDCWPNRQSLWPGQRARRRSEL